MKNYRCVSIILCLTACAVLLGCNPFAAKSQSPLLEYLGYIPDEPEYREYIVYGDMQAWYSAWGIPRPETFTQVMDSEYKSELWVMQSRQTVPPQLLVNYQTVEDEKDFYGFNLYTIDRHFQAGMGNKQVTLIDLADSSRVVPALQAYGYESSNLGGGTLFSFGEDNKMHTDAPNAAGRFPFFNRIHLNADRLLIAPSTGVVESALDAQTGKVASLADDKVFHAVASALEESTLTNLGRLVGVLLLELEPLNKDPDFDLAAFATFQADENTAYLALLLVLPPGQDADAAAGQVSERMNGYVSKVAGPLDERWVFQNAYGATQQGLPVAVVVMKADVQRGYNEGLDENYAVVMDWSRLVATYDLQFLEAQPK